MSRGTAYPGTGEELSLKAPAASERQLEFCPRYSQFLPSDWFSMLWRCGESVVAHHLLLLGIMCWFGEQDKDYLHCLQALNPSSSSFTLCVSPRVGTGKGVDDEQNKLLTPALQKSTASHTCHPAGRTKTQCHEKLQSRGNGQLSSDQSNVTRHIWCWIPVWMKQPEPLVHSQVAMEERLEWLCKGLLPSTTNSNLLFPCCENF